MRDPLEDHVRVWKSKPLLREIYGGFFRRIHELIDPGLPGRVVEIGAGVGNLKMLLPQTIATDLAPKPWTDVVCDAYRLPFASGSLSHLVLLDVFHHLEAPNAFLREAWRVLGAGGRLILFEPYISWSSLPVYTWLHHEPVAWRAPINFSSEPPSSRRTHAAQGNATRLFFRRESPGWPPGWKVFHASASSCFAHILSGGFSRPAFYPMHCLAALRRLDRALSRWPRLFGGRCLIVLTPA